MHRFELYGGLWVLMGPSRASPHRLLFSAFLSQSALTIVTKLGVCKTTRATQQLKRTTEHNRSAPAG
eukprot:4557779-Amphidinium_carterae.1